MTYTPFQWNAILAPDRKWQDAYAGVEEEVKAFIETQVSPLTTADLVERLYPEAAARGEGITARKRIYSALEALAKHGLKDYWEPGEARPLKHNKSKLVTPKLWRAPPVKLCPHCGGML